MIQEIAVWLFGPVLAAMIAVAALVFAIGVGIAKFVHWIDTPDREAKRRIEERYGR